MTFHSNKTLFLILNLACRYELQVDFLVCGSCPPVSRSTLDVLELFGALVESVSDCFGSVCGVLLPFVCKCAFAS